MSKATTARSEGEGLGLQRHDLRELLEGVRNPESGLARTWNVVEALELLLDAGQYKVAQRLARYICTLLHDDDRQRLFAAYETLCQIAIDGTLHSKLAILDTINQQMSVLGHSQADRVRIALVRARALGIGISMKALPEGELFAARVLIESQYRAALSAGKVQLALVAGLELLRTYVYSTSPEFVAARGLLAQLVSLEDPASKGVDISTDVRCDLARFRYFIEISLAGAVRNDFLERRLRSEVAELGELAQALAELTINRLAPEECDREALEGAHAVFVSYGHLSAAAETALLLAGQSLAVGHHARAQRLFSAAFSIGDESGSQYTQISATLGLFHTHAASGDSVECLSLAHELSGFMPTELGLSGFGVTVVPALQVIGDLRGAAKLARRCLSVARSGRVTALELEALTRVAGCFAAAGNWNKAAATYIEAAECAKLRRDFAARCDLQIAALQAELVLFNADLVGKSTQAVLLRRREICDALLGDVHASMRQVSDPFQAAVVRARVEQVHGEILCASGDTLGCIRSLGEARKFFMEVGFVRNVALVDACSGVALLEVAKSQGAAVWEEAFASLQRGLDLFERHNDVAISWKIKYYLAFGASMRSKRESDPPKQAMWAEMARSWLDGAVRDQGLLAGGQTAPDLLLQVGQAGWSCEFAPFLEASALAALERSLRRVEPEGGSIVTKRSTRGRAARFKGQLH